MSFLLKKIFKMRDKAAEKRGQGDMEKPFLEHLEDLRVMLMKSVSTLLITSILCFVFKAELMQVILQPVINAGLDKIGIQNLPEDMEASDWQRSYNIATSASNLSPEKRTIYIDAVCGDDKALRTDVEAVSLFRAALTLEEEDRETFLKKVTGGDAVLLKRIQSFLTANPDATVGDLDRKTNLIDMSALQPAEGFTLSLKLAFFGGIILAFPLLIFYILEFVLPGLTAREKQLLLPSGIIGFGLFLAGVAFAYWVVTPKALEFFTNYDSEMGIRTDWRIGYYVSFVLRLTLIFGLCFELPVVVMAMVKLGLLSFSGMIKTRSYAVLIIVILSAVVTPPDAITLTFLALPMIVLYELCIWIAWFMERKEKKQEQADREAYRKRMEEKRRRQAAIGGGAGEMSGDDHSIQSENGEHDHADDPYHDGHHGSYGEGHDPYDHDHNYDHGEDDPYHEDYHGREDRDQDSNHEDVDGADEDSQHEDGHGGPGAGDDQSSEDRNEDGPSDSDHLEQDEGWQQDQEDPSPSEDDIYEPFDDDQRPESPGEDAAPGDGEQEKGYSDGGDARDRDDKPESADRDDKPESADRDDKPESADRDDKPESTDRDDKPESADRDDKPESTDDGSENEKGKESDHDKRDTD